MENFFASSSILFNLTIPIELEKLVKRHFVKNSIHSGSTEFIFIFMYILIGCLGVTVNLLVILVILSSKRLRNLENSLILNLCMADILLCLWSIPFTLYQILRRDWSLGQIMCSTVPFLQATIVFVIAQTITVIAFDRLSVITGQHSLKRKHHHSHHHSQCGITKRIPLIWISSIILGSPLIYFYKEVNFNYNGIPLYNRCIEDWSGEIRIIYSTLTFTISLVIPIICLVASQVKIVTFLKRQGNLDFSQLAQVTTSRPVIATLIGAQSSSAGLSENEAGTGARETSNNNKLKSINKIIAPTLMNEATINNDQPSTPTLMTIEGDNVDSDKISDSRSKYITANHETGVDTICCTNNDINNNYKNNLASNNLATCDIITGNKVSSTSSSSSSNSRNNDQKRLIMSLSSSFLVPTKKPVKLPRYSVSLRPVRFTLAKGVRNRRAIVSLYRVSVTFILSWLPLNIVNLYLDLIDSPSMSGAKVYLILGICHLIAISSSVTNAIFYGLMNTNIKRELSKIRYKLNHKKTQSQQPQPQPPPRMSTPLPSHVI